MAIFAGYAHDALLYATDDEMLTSAVPFLREGLSNSETVVLVCGERRTRLLREALGDDSRIVVLPRTHVYQEGVEQAVSTYQEFMVQEVARGVSQVRLVGEADCGDGPQQLAEWSRFESMLNGAFAPYPIQAVCMYNASELPPEALAVAELTHPHLRRRTGRRPSPHYRGPEEFLRWGRQPPPDPLERTDPLVSVDDLADVTTLRHSIRSAIEGRGLSEEAEDDFIVGVNEIVTNATLHGRPPISVRLWASDRRIVCSVTDRGDGLDDPLAGHRPLHAHGLTAGGMGIWIARQLCERVEMFRSPKGFTVRLGTSIYNGRRRVGVSHG